MPPKSAVNSNLQYLSVRKATFTGGVRVGNAKLLKYWPHDKPSAEEMAEKGFYYTPTKTQGDQVTCFWCGKKEKNLENEASISNVHFSHNSKCPYGVIYNFLSQYRKDEDMASFWSRLVEENELPISVLEPHSQISIRLRLATFKNLWKFDSRKKTKVTARGMAEAGFFFAPTEPGDDRVICMYCGCPLSDWDLGDDPRAEHENNSRAYRRDNSQPTCHFLETLEEPVEEENSVLSNAELQHIPSLDGSPNMDKLAKTPSASPSLGPTNDSSVDSPINKSPNSLMDIMSPLLPGLLSSDPPAQNELDQFDISIDQLSDHGTHLDKNPPPTRRYPRRKKQAVFGEKMKEEEASKSVTSLVLEISKEPEISESQESQTPIEKPENLLPPAADSSDIHHSTSMSIPQDTEDGDYAESVEEIESLQKNSVKIEPSNISTKASRSRFSDDEFGINEKDIANILNSPRKDRKMKVVKKKQTVTLPVIHDLSDQNIGDYDEQNLSFLEKDLRLQPVEQHSKGPDLDHENLKSSLSPQKPPTSFKPHFSEHLVPDSSLMEVTNPDIIKSQKSRETILVESPEKVGSPDEDVSKFSEDIPPEIVPDNLSPEKHTLEKIMAANHQYVDDDIILDHESPEKPVKKLDAPSEYDSDPLSESTAVDMDIDVSEEEEKIEEKIEEKTEEERQIVELKKEPTNSSDHLQTTDSPSHSVTSDKIVTKRKSFDESKGDFPSQIDIPKEGEDLKKASKSPEISEKKEILPSPIDNTLLEEKSKNTPESHKPAPSPVQSPDSSKRSIGPSLEEPAAKKLKGNEQKVVDENAQDNPKPSLKAEILKNGNGGDTEMDPNQDKSEIPQAGESPTKEVVISPSSYKEYMADYKKMKEEFADSSGEDSGIEKDGSDDSTKPLAQNTSNVERPNQTLDEKGTPQKKEYSCVKDLLPEREKSIPDSDRDLPSYIGDSASEAPPLLSVPPTPAKVNPDDANPDSRDERSEENGESKITENSEKAEKAPGYVLESKDKSMPSLKGPEKSDIPSEERKLTNKDLTEKSKPVEFENPINTTSNANDERISFLGVQSSTPVKTTPGNSSAKPEELPKVSLNAALAQIKELEEAIEYVTDIAAQGYELNNDVDGTLTNFISAMPEEEEEMTIEQWIQHNAQSCRKIIQDLAKRMIENYEADFDRVIDFVDNLETID